MVGVYFLSGGIGTKAKHGISIANVFLLQKYDEGVRLLQQPDEKSVSKVAVTMLILMLLVWMLQFLFREPIVGRERLICAGV
jgi:hypothetical protein